MTSLATVTLADAAAPRLEAAGLRRESARTLADCAVRALIEEALLTPKPALVDQRGPGAHHDLDLGRLLRSARALHAPFRAMALVAHGRLPDAELRETLGAIGRRAEQRMLAATGGSNAHRGAIWVLGLLTAALAMSDARAPRASARPPCAERAEQRPARVRHFPRGGGAR
jgi:triphosphoribosyl-dephospho-CoA synthase